MTFTWHAFSFLTISLWNATQQCVISSDQRRINQRPACNESTHLALESMPFPILTGTAKIVRDRAQVSSTKPTVYVLNGKPINSLTHTFFSPLFSFWPFLYQFHYGNFPNVAIKSLVFWGICLPTLSVFHID